MSALSADFNDTRVARQELRVTLHAGYAGLQALRERWSAILSNRARTRFFHEWAWYEAYLRHLEPTPGEVFFALLTSGDEPAAIVPLKRVFERRAGLRSPVLMLPGHPHLPLGDVVAGDGVESSAVLAALVSGLSEQGMPWASMQFNGFLEESLLAAMPPDGALPTYREELKTCDQMVCDGPWEGFARRLSRYFRCNLNNARNRIAREGGATYEIVNDPQRLPTLFREFLQVEASGWKGADGTRTAILLEPRLVGFYQRLIDHFAPAGRLFINTMRFADQVIASEFCVADADTLYILKLGYDERFCHLSPGNSLLEQLVRWCATDGRIRYVNLVGNPSWFQSWKPEHIPMYGMRVFNTTAPGQLRRLAFVTRNRLRPCVRAIRNIARGESHLERAP